MRQLPEQMLVARRLSSGRLAIVEKLTGPSPARLNSDERRAQATAMMVRRIFGEGSTADLADRFNVSERTVDRRLAKARQLGVPEEARRVFVEEMLPQSMAVMQEALRGDDMKLAVTVALKVVDGLRALELPPDPAAARPIVEESLELWRSRVTRRYDPGAARDAEVDPTAITPLTAEGSGGCVEAVLVPADDPAGPIDSTAPAAEDSTPDGIAGLPRPVAEGA